MRRSREMWNSLGTGLVMTLMLAGSFIFLCIG